MTQQGVSNRVLVFVAIKNNLMPLSMRFMSVQCLGTNANSHLPRLPGECYPEPRDLSLYPAP